MIRERRILQIARDLGQGQQSPQPGREDHQPVGAVKIEGAAAGMIANQDQPALGPVPQGGGIIPQKPGREIGPPALEGGEDQRTVRSSRILHPQGGPQRVAIPQPAIRHQQGAGWGGGGHPFREILGGEDMLAMHQADLALAPEARGTSAAAIETDGQTLEIGMGNRLTIQPPDAGKVTHRPGANDRV